MNIQYYHKNIDSLTEASRVYISEKLTSVSKIAAITDIRIEIDQQKDGNFHMQVSLRSLKSQHIANAIAHDVNGCIDQIEDELKSQLRKKKTRVRDLMKRGARSIKKRFTIADDARL